MRVLLGLSALNWTDRAQLFRLYKAGASRPLFMAHITPCLNTDVPKEKQQPGAYGCGVASWGGPIWFKRTADCVLKHEDGVEVSLRWQDGGMDGD